MAEARANEVQTEREIRYAERRLDILMREAGFLRDEALLCIEQVRKLTAISITAAGGVLPVVAALLVGRNASGMSMIEALTAHAIFLDFVCFGVSLCAAAILQIYTGVFGQIFSFARYFREVLIPDVNETLRLLDPSKAADASVLRWELWLQQQRRPRTDYLADVDLKAEPALIGFICFSYALSFLLIAVIAKQELPIVVFAAINLAGILVYLCNRYRAFHSVLKSSGSKGEPPNEAA